MAIYKMRQPPAARLCFSRAVRSERSVFDPDETTSRGPDERDGPLADRDKALSGGIIEGSFSLSVAPSAESSSFLGVGGRFPTSDPLDLDEDMAPRRRGLSD